MIGGLVNQQYKDIYDYIFHDLSQIIIPFSEFFKQRETIFIYTGTEQIPFNEKDPEFIDIMKKEFLK